MEDSKVLERKIAAIMFSDMKGFSAKMGEDEETTFRLLSEHNKVMRETIEKFGGKVIKTIGDAFMSEFASPVNAVKCAYEVQSQFLRHNLEKQDSQKIVLRIGIHMGDVLITENDIFGDGVNIAARLEPQAPPGGICVSDVVYNFVRKTVKLNFEDGGQLALKNIKEPVQVYKLIPTLEEISEKGPRQILHYQIKEKIFESAQGDVYRAEDVRLRRVVILKRLNSAISSNPAIKEKLLEEIRIGAVVNHPNMLTILDYCEYDKDLYLIMEYVDGLDISKWIITNKAKAPEFFTHATQVAEVLMKLHEGGFHQLDVKASDILISKTGWLKFLYLGLTKYFPEENRKQFLNSGESLRFRSPEQIRGELGDARSDIFSLGVVFYEFCTGQVPFTDEQIRIAVPKGSFPPIPAMTILNPDIPEALANIIMKCIAFKPEDRYQRMKDVLVDLNVQRQIHEGVLVEDAERAEKERLERELEKAKLKEEFAEKSPIQIVVSPDCVKVYLTISDIRYFEDKTALDIIERLLKDGIVRNVNRDKIAEIVEKKQIVNNVLIAEGVAAKDGNNAQIEFKINIEAIKKLRLFKNDRIDLTTISQWEFVRQNELIARKIAPEPGESGIDVYGKSILAKPGKDYRFPAGKGVFVSDDGVSLYAEHNGITYIDQSGRLNVLNILVYDCNEISVVNFGEIPQEDIVIKDKVTGKIDWDVPRSIYIKGDVVAEGEIRSTNGEIFISGEVKGKSRDETFFIESGKKISAQRIEFGEVRSGGSVDALKGIYHSNVTANNGIRADEGALAGGNFYAENWIRVKALGNADHEDTIIHVGSGDNITSPEIDQLQQQIDELRRVIRILQPQLEEYEKQVARYERFKEVKKDLFLSVYMKFKQISANLEKSKLEEKKRKQAIQIIRDKLYEKLVYEKKIYVSSTIFPGVIIKIMDLDFVVDDVYHKPQIIVRNNQINVLHEKV